MTTPIHPGALKAHRLRKLGTQARLAEESRVSLPTIKRIENTKDQTYAARDSVAQALAKALGIGVEDLADPPSGKVEREAMLRELGLRPVRRMIAAEAALAFDIVEDIYGISARSQIEMAPLFATLLAEGSLAWRRRRVEEIDEAAGRLRSLAHGPFSFAVYAAQRAEMGADSERIAIEKRDLFSEHVDNDTYDVDFDPSEHIPFACYLQEFAREVHAKRVTFENYGWRTSEGMPAYWVGADIIEELTAGDLDAKYALLQGHVRLKDIPEELRAENKSPERVEWMIGRIPEREHEERKKRTAQDELIASDLDDLLSTPNKVQGGDNV